MQRSGPGSQRHALRSCYSSCPTGTCSYFCPLPVCTPHLPDNNLSCGMFFICTTLIPKHSGPCVNVNPKRRSIHSTSLLWIYEGSGLSPESSFDRGGVREGRVGETRWGWVQGGRSSQHYRQDEENRVGFKNSKKWLLNIRGWNLGSLLTERWLQLLRSGGVDEAVWAGLIAG